MSSKGNHPVLTVVGGQPDRLPHVRVSSKSFVGVEKVLLRAAKDPAFQKQLLADVDAALEGLGISLIESERAMLKAASPATLQLLIRNVERALPRQPKFLKIVAAATASLAAGTVSCDNDIEEPLAPGGINPCYESDVCYVLPDVKSEDVGAKDVVGDSKKDTSAEDVAPQDVTSEDVAAETGLEASSETGAETSSDAVSEDVASEAQDLDALSEASQQDVSDSH